MEKVTLNAEVRNESGKQANNKLRKEGSVPAVVYKKGDKALSLKVNARELFHVLHTSAGGNVIITLNIDSGDKKKGKTVIVKEVQYEPIKGGVVHLDFQEISLTDKITVDIAIETKGEPKGVKIDGGVLDHPTKELNVECLPTEIPEKIDIHVEELEIGDSIKVKDLDIPFGVTVLTDPEQTVCSVMHPEIEEEPEEEEALAGEAAEPEVIRERKAEEGEEGPAPKQKEESKETKEEKQEK